MSAIEVLSPSVAIIETHATGTAALRNIHARE